MNCKCLRALKIVLLTNFEDKPDLNLQIGLLVRILQEEEAQIEDTIKVGTIKVSAIQRMKLYRD